MPDNPSYNEYAVWSNNHQSRDGVKVDAFFIHTTEGDANADSLARYLGGNVSASYHYTVSEDYNDHGVTVCDVVDTDLASWSVLSANNRSINLCFAGSRAAWTRDQWLQQSKAIDVAAYLAVQDCRKYGIPIRVIAPPYTGRIPGISDHRYVTKVLGDGTHTDVGDNFPWDVFTAAIDKYAGITPTTAPAPAPTPAPAPKPAPAPTPVTVPDSIHRTDIEWRAQQYGSLDAVTAIVTLAKTGDKRATLALARLEQVNPAALKTFLAQKG